MEGRIYDIVTDLLRDDITKDKAIEELLVLCDVGKCNELLQKFYNHLAYGLNNESLEDWMLDDFKQRFL